MPTDPDTHFTCIHKKAGYIMTRIPLKLQIPTLMKESQIEMKDRVLLRFITTEPASESTRVHQSESRKLQIHQELRSQSKMLRFVTREQYPEAYVFSSWG